MRIAITGNLGHIGSLITKVLQRDNHNIICLDNLSTSRYPSLFDLAHGKSIQFIEADILTYDLEYLFRDVDVVIHLAAITNAPATVDSPARTFEINYIGTCLVTEAAKANGCKLIFPSTTSVYGKSSGEVDETCTELHPQSPYAESKMEAERYILTYYNDKSVVLRFGTICGASTGARFHTFCCKSVYEACLGKPITVWESAIDQLRPYLYIGDAVTAIQHAMKHDLFGQGIFNVVTENSTPRDIFKCIKHYRPDATMTLTRSPLMNQLSYSVNSEKLRSTGWKPTGSIELGIAETMSLLAGVRGWRD